MADTIGLELDIDTLYLTRGRDFKWLWEQQDSSGTPVDFPAGELYFELDTGGAHNAIQRVGILHANGGTYKLGFNGNYPADPQIDYNDISINPENQPGDITDYIERIPTASIPFFPRNTTIGAGNVSVSDVELYPEWRFDIQLTGTPQNEIQEVDVTDVIQQIATFFGIPIGQTITKGSFKLTYNHVDSDVLSFDATALEMQTALEKLPGIAPGNVLVTKPADYRWQIEFRNVLGNRNVDQITAHIYQTSTDSTNIFDLFNLGGLLTSVSSKTIQQGQVSAFNEQLVNLVNKTVNDFFNLFDDLLGINIEFTIDNPDATTPDKTPSISLVVTGLKPWDANTIEMFLLNEVVDFLQAFLNGALDWAHVWSVVSINFAWNTYFNVEFVGELANWTVPALTSDASLLTDDSNEVDPVVTVEVIKPGKNRYDNWHFVIDGAEASLKVESEVADLVQPRVKWQLVFLPEGEPKGGDPIALGRVAVQPT